MVLATYLIFLALGFLIGLFWGIVLFFSFSLDFQEDRVLGFTLWIRLPSNSDLLASASRVLGIKAHATMPGNHFGFYFCFTMWAKTFIVCFLISGYVILILIVESIPFLVEFVDLPIDHNVICFWIILLISVLEFWKYYIIMAFLICNKS